MSKFLKYIITLQMLVMIQRGADLEKMTENNDLTPVGLAVEGGHVEALELLLKNGADVNRKSRGDTALHMASLYDVLPGREKIIFLLFEYGADINILDRSNKTPLQCATINEKIIFLHKKFLNKYTLLKELAKLKFEQRYICDENLEHLQQHKNIRQHFENCLGELQRMKSLTIYNDISVYNILQMRHQQKKLIALTRNEDFVTAFETLRYNESFEYYGEELDHIFDNALDKCDVLLMEEKKLYSIFKSSFPELIIRYIAYFSTE